MIANKSQKNTLSIRLTESVVFLRAADAIGRRRSSQNNDSPPALLRGLLTLNLVKPTRVTSIEVELQGRSTTAWPEGIGARRIEITEEHKIYNASTVFFRAGNMSSSGAGRRTLSVDPGLSMYHEDDYRSGGGSVEGDQSETPRNSFSRERSVGPSGERNLGLERRAGASVDLPPLRIGRRLSMDQAYFQRDYVSHREEAYIPTPPYTPTALSPAPSTSHVPIDVQSPSPRLPSASHILQESRAALRSELVERITPPSTLSGHSHGHHHTHLQPPSAGSSSSSLSSNPNRSHSLSRRHSIEEEPEPTETSPSPHRSPEHEHDHEDQDDSEFDGFGFAPRERSTTRSPHRTNPPPDDDNRGRKSTKRFSFAAAVSHVIDAVRVRSSSPRMRVAQSQDRSSYVSSEPSIPERDGSGSGSRDRDGEGRGRSRVRSTEKGKGKEGEKKERSAFGRVGEVLGWEEEGAEWGDGWKEFRKGTYTYPISFTIPASSPPTLHCTYGSVIWRLKASVHRPGAFTPKLTAMREVTVVATPEEDAEDTENIIVERQWDNQMQYFIAVSGRTFWVGGRMPVQIALMPLAKIKVYRISVHLEEKVEYLTNMKRVARTDPIRRIVLLSLKYPDKDGPPILPLISDDPNAFRNSPLSAMADDDSEEALSEMASTLMGPGPWSFHHNLELPKSCDQLHFTNKNKKSNISITHTLKIIFRVERGDDTFIDVKSGKRKMFDIVVQTPVHILSCLCNPDWISLPRYTEDSDLTISSSRSCPCSVRPRISNLNVSADQLDSFQHHLNHHSPVPTTSFSQTATITPDTMDHDRPRRSIDSVSTVEDIPMINAQPLLLGTLSDSLFERNNQFERLIAGQESEIGEAPPAYEDVPRYHLHQHR
ncbi:hypothetical protein JAAARDRAFT_41651 [Jaapia argillacea MUCL 33604]|uniref:Arrestin C-terminal-like domain-containing protein n=1 Tax=Jaapia argillacea MUCL 33604 TaxID=933084 RepID=A0A067P7W3_9AGAM|nr:hypothetical protein JAAARDRAFT_41651 [Jaapia argillacea MUCL 33604]